MAFYHTVPSYVSNYSQVVKMGELQFAVSAFPLSPTMSFYQYEQEANPRGLGPPAPNVRYTLPVSSLLTNRSACFIRLTSGPFSKSLLNSSRLPSSPRKNSVRHTVLLSSPGANGIPRSTGSGWAYGLRVIPIPTGDDDGPDRNSVASRDGRKDYEIWRRWDDCLWFQEEIELEYSIQAREKRRRLVQGKGVKKDGVYLDSKRAASFESLPPGPDPTSVALDLHKYIPKLTKKSTLFRANQAIIDQRQRQFTSLIDALFAPNVPVLIEELRQSLKFRDFFGWWRRDKDFISKQGPEKGKGREPPAIGTIPFYLETSNPSQVFSDTSSSRDSRPPRSKSSRPATTDGSSSGSIRSSTRERTRDHAATRRRKTIATATKSTPGIAVSSASFDGSYESRSASRASLRSVASDEMDPTVLMWDGQEQLNPSDRISPQALLDAFPQTPMVRETFEKIQCPPSPEADSPILGLEALPEEQELELLPPQMSGPEYESGRRPTRSRGNSASDGHHRNAIVFAPETVLGDSELLEIPDRSPTMTNTTSVSSRQSSVFSHNSYALSQRTSASDIPPCPSPRRSFDSCTADAVGYSSSSPASPQTPWCSDNDTFPVGGPSIKWNPRDSVMTIDSIMTDASVDHVLPRSAAKPGDFSATRTFSPGPRGPSHRSRPMSVPEEEGYIEDCDDSILESYLYGEYRIRHIPHPISETSILPANYFLTSPRRYRRNGY